MNRILFLIGCLMASCSPQPAVVPLDPTAVQSVVLYDIDPRENFDPQLPPLDNVSSYRLKSEDAHLLFQNVEPGSEHLWKGAFMAVVTCKDDRKYHLAVSYYGGFFRVIETRQVFRFTASSRAEYERLKDTVMRDVFIPSRREDGGK